MNLITLASGMFMCTCTTGRYTAADRMLEPPSEKAKEFNYNYNQAQNIVKYTNKHKKARQKISEHNRDVQNDNWYRLNANKKNPDLRHQPGQFRFYRNN
jgi:hypothetical protein